MLVTIPWSDWDEVVGMANDTHYGLAAYIWTHADRHHGRSVAPRLYVAVGLFGNLNHLAGASQAGTVFAINTDPAAEIFANCDVGLVADWRAVLPHVVEELRNRVSVREAGEPVRHGADPT